jgi:hypothetical protein
LVGLGFDVLPPFGRMSCACACVLFISVIAA